MDNAPLRVMYLGALVSIATTTVSSDNYDRFQVFRINFVQGEKWTELYSRLLQSSPSGTNITADIWRYSKIKGEADLLLNEYSANKAKLILEKMGMQYNVTISNVGRVIYKEKASSKRRRKRHITGNDVIGHYVRYEEILEWMNDVILRHPTFTRIINIGLTEEGRQMKILKIGLPGRNKWKIWLDGGIHAREWISPTTVLYLAHQLLQGYLKKDNSTMQFLNKLDFYFLPVVNPDGYEYSHMKDRLWRKNRKPDAVTGCHGTDLNRNWQFQWGIGFSSNDPCAEDFRGNSPEDSVEVENIVNFLLPRAQAFIAFLTYHSYGQRFITRWDYSDDIVPKDHDQLMALALKAVEAMHRVHGIVYEAGRAPELMYPYGGGSPDWARAIANIKYSYLIELRDQHSFILPAEDIVPTGQENWAALRVITDDVLLYYGDIPAPHVTDASSWPHDNRVSCEHEATQDDKMAVIYHGEGTGCLSRPKLTLLCLLFFVDVLIWNFGLQ